MFDSDRCPCRAKRCDHLFTLVVLNSTSRPTSSCFILLAHSRTIRALMQSRCGVVPAWTHHSSSVRSSGVIRSTDMGRPLFVCSIPNRWIFAYHAIIRRLCQPIAMAAWKEPDHLFLNSSATAFWCNAHTWTSTENATRGGVNHDRARGRGCVRGRSGGRGLARLARAAPLARRSSQ